jgi:hypothetical protein
MYKLFVYLDLKSNRLMIVNEQIENHYFLQLMNNDGQNLSMLYSFCKLFCIGYIMGSSKKTPINDINEFQ